MEIKRDKLLDELLVFFRDNFEIDNPGLNDDLREEHGFDSLDAVEVLAKVEKMLGIKLKQEEKKNALEIRTLNQICDYVESIASSRQESSLS